ncbi:psidin [Bugula neritina]|uniref:Psidin n=1 Tax=Bugula neritina TaxID=10212 RepID=A0A7J7KPC5_BUGNE|nr:psidin [Bugula neritina]
MAPKKKNHVQQASADSTQAVERKLRYVYDLLDFGNYKKALQEAEKVLKKHPNSNSAKSLKGLSLIRLGRLRDGYDIIKEVHDTKPADESTLQVLTVCYKELNKLWLIAELYENAVEQSTDNEEYLSHLFMAHVRLGNYKKQHQTAVKLHKLKPDNNPYYYWSIMSLILQAKEADPKLAASMLLPLAEKMARTNRTKLASLELNAGSNLMIDSIFKQQRVAELLISVDKVNEAIDLYKHLILERPDNWLFYTSYISTSLQLIDSSAHNGLTDQSDAANSSKETNDSPSHLNNHSSEDITVEGLVSFLRKNSEET